MSASLPSPVVMMQHVVEPQSAVLSVKRKSTLPSATTDRPRRSNRLLPADAGIFLVNWASPSLAEHARIRTS